MGNYKTSKAKLKRTQTVLSANEVFSLTSYLEDKLVEIEIEGYYLEEERWDDPGDWDSVTKHIEEVAREREKLERLLKMLGKDPNDCWERARRRINYGE